MKHRITLAIATVLLAAGPCSFAQPGAAYSGSATAIELPEISAIVNGQADLTDPEDPDRHQKVRIKEAEVAVAGYLYPSIHGDFIVAFEQEYVDEEVETEVEVEEAYLSFLELPGGLQAVAGRKLISFGRLNPIHPHHWAFPETPRALENLFGDHPWFDDGLDLNLLVPNPWDAYLKVSAGVYNGRSLEHGHGDAEEDHDHAEEHEEDHAEEHEEEHHEGEGEHHEGEGHAHAEDAGHAHGHGEVVEWDGQVFIGRLFADLPVSEQLAFQLGYSLVIDEGERNLLQGLDLVLRHQEPDSFRKTKWHTELLFADDDVRGSSPFGLFSYVTYAPDKYWEFGGRYDFTELLENDSEDLWAGSGFVTRYLTHATYLRGGYQYTEYSMEEREEEHLVSLQFVWGIGPHSHRLSD